MNQVVSDLLSLLKLQPTGDGQFRGQCQDLGFGNLFGGQMLGQSLAAAMATLPDTGLQPHSLHSYFLRPGNVTDELLFEVDVLRDGRSFSSRNVRIIQRDKAIFTMMCSFAQPEEGFEHQDSMPDIRGPEGITSQLELARRFQQWLPEKNRHIYTADKPIEMRVLDPINVAAPEKKDPIKYVWMKPAAKLSEVTELENASNSALNNHEHACVLAYTTDFNLLPTALHPHGVSIFTKNMRVASLDHSIWFHRPINFNDWLLYVIDSPNAAGGRGFCRGQIFDNKGQLVASVAQEGLMRQMTE